jgi:hypothetical protein
VEEEKKKRGEKEHINNLQPGVLPKSSIKRNIFTHMYILCEIWTDQASLII